MNSLNPPASGPRNPRPDANAFRLGRPAPRHPYRPALSIEVRVGVAPGDEESSVLPLILSGIRERAAVEMRARTAPAVSVLGGEGLPGLDLVEADDAAVASLVTRLHAAGHARIGF